MSRRVAQVVIIEEDANARGLIRESLESLPNLEVLAETESHVYGYELVRHNRPQLVFVDLRNDPTKGLETVRKISTYFRDTLVFVSGSQMDLETILACMRAGAREFLSRPLNPEEILTLTQKHLDDLLVDSDSGDRSGRVLTIFSNKGGLGKTTLAVNLALSLSRVIGKPVALVDLNLQLGDITTFLDIAPKQTIVDIAKNIARVDRAYLENSLAYYEYDGAEVFVLADPLHAEEAEEVTAAQINTVLTVLKAAFDYVIVDTTTSFDSKTLTALDLADNILLTSIVNLPSIRSTQRVLTLFDRLGYEKQKVKLIINRYIPDEEIDLDDVEETLDHEVFWKIPNNYNVVMTAINRGVPIIGVEKSDSMVDNFTEFAHRISGVLNNGLLEPAAVGNNNFSQSARGGNKSLLGNLFGKK
ncbi:MAG: AAA family ATPase [Candidatus Melainabacteria bacterium]|nr:AAA family ATPase [Candidatus Melainabacteria bacterium]